MKGLADETGDDETGDSTKLPHSCFSLGMLAVGPWACREALARPPAKVPGTPAEKPAAGPKA
jgi:hypothetical protein